MKKIANFVIDNFLTQEEFREIDNLLVHELTTREIIYADSNGNNLDYDANSCSVVSEEMGRITARRLPVSHSIRLKFFNHAMSITGASEQELQHFDISGTEYNLKYGNPCLPPHYDSGESNFLLDYQAASNIDWTINVDDIEYKMSDNSVLNIYNIHQQHHRPKKIFRDGDFVRVLFINFEIPSFDPPQQDTASISKKNMLWHLGEAVE